MATQVDQRSEAPPPPVDDRLTLYFRSIGLSDHAIQAAIREVDERLDAASSESPASRTPQTAIQEAMSLVQEWLDRLPDVAEGASHGPMLWRLRGVLPQQLGPILGSDDPPNAVREVLHESCRPILPPEQRIEMAAQPLGAMPPLLRRAFWRLMGSRFMTSGRNAVRVLTTREG